MACPKQGSRAASKKCPYLSTRRRRKYRKISLDNNSEGIIITSRSRLYQTLLHTGSEAFADPLSKKGVITPMTMKKTVLRLTLFALLMGAVATVPAMAGSAVIGSVAGSMNATVGGQSLLPNTTIFSGDSLQVRDGVAVIAVGNNSRVVFGRDTVAFCARSERRNRPAEPGQRLHASPHRWFIGSCEDRDALRDSGPGLQDAWRSCHAEWVRCRDRERRSAEG